MAAEILYTIHFYVLFLLLTVRISSSFIGNDWPAFLVQNTTGSLKVTPESSVLCSNALVFTRLWEYDDVNDTADPEHMPPSSFFQPYKLQNFTWDDLNKTLDPTAHTALLCGRDASESFSNGSLCLKFSAFDSEGRDQGWPSLLHNANSSQLRVGLDGVSQWVSSPVNSTSPVLGYAQWKPVAYCRPLPHSTPVPVAQLPPSGLVLAYFGGVRQTTGQTTHSTTPPTTLAGRTVLVGLYSPPVDSFSPLVLVIMAVGLGTPMLIILLGGVCVCVSARTGPKRRSTSQSTEAKPGYVYFKSRL
ncbi:unnamed protein product [Coregonus sp. 'balchen']|nr:unnamed protein product [Coregonus sp. 'balchen']